MMVVVMIFEPFVTIVMFVVVTLQALLDDSG
jgi:hypothetical protein